MKKLLCFFLLCSNCFAVTVIRDWRDLQEARGAAADDILRANGAHGCIFTPISSFAVTTLTGTANQVLVNGTSAVATSGAITLTTPQNIGTGSSPTFSGLTLSSPLTAGNGGTGITSLGTGVATALGVNVGSAGALVTFNGAGGTPSSLTLTSATGLPLSTGVTGDLPFANLVQGAALSVVANATNGTADFAALAAASDNQILRRSGTALAFGSIDLSQSNAVGASILGLTNGGSAKSLSANNGGIVWTDSDSMEVLAGTATANKILLSGATATPAWSTSTIPSSAGATALKHLKSDGTNYALTASTFSETATLNTMLIGNGTNWITSTPTLARNLTGTIPVVCATSNLTAQGAAIAATTIYAVPASQGGFYRVSWMATVTRAATTSCTLGGTTGFQLKFTDLNDSVVKTMNPAGVTHMTSSTNATGTTVSGVFCAYCVASSNLQYIFGYTSSGATTMLYDLSITVESL